MSSISAHRIETSPQQRREADRLIELLQRQGISNPAVLEAIRRTPRHFFIDEALASHAYANNALPIGQGQTISQPYIVARMTEILLSRGKLDAVLEVGTGCGYQTAILAQLVRRVYSVELLASLSEQAQTRLGLLGFTNVKFKHSDGKWGWSENAPYDAILVTAAPQTVPEPLLEQLALNASLIIPVGPQRSGQVLYKITRFRNRYEQEPLEAVSFVPLR
ncbi:protein-L-isoaspartate(D-aspartate) O-methyltransferase [Beggiatoa leptomitoformis]|uniref:Protein-L-isoaspartate O-methyltransferase n=1 Tax=Beggiatoa leptomitoformis TaxID=288004 RepID=A0A2N9YJI8_9GAMM|nr:protein-L-isoaspartate(D-aspartate) O-methyltransferase [Beggiatoa leptomitoformis]ALG67368.1 protein-L-isoaspartate(D-aspartate) O-methyltransferase [Beggiatoa leptomitoformis]AUI70426.1 protein-L-isoaspartate(D-aspartate) O-methyltransferase [Beggiatoa leptomitoformis]